MNAGRALVSERVRALFDRVVELAPEQRDAVLRRHGASADERRAVCALLNADGRRGDLFETPAAQWARQLEQEAGDLDAMVGQRAGPYRIVRLLGKGGSSVVFRAVRAVGDAEQTVALKLLHHGLFAPESRRRFRREQAILTQLSHPNIARLIDAGITEAGIPYIAMEEIEGIDLLAHADANRLGCAARVQLLIEVCRAVDAAHRALVVHRDLKPTNVLVTHDGHVKVLDFGIAKLLDGGDEATETLHIALTPGYAAPEQYGRGPLTTSADVYSLGVLGGELLFGARLGPDAAWPELAGSERAAAWQRRRRLNGEALDLLRTSLASEPERRYASAGHLADDLGRFLRREPLAARPVSHTYRLCKFVARNRISVGALALLLAAIIAALSNAAWQAGRVREQAVRASAARDFLVSVFEAGGADLRADRRPGIQDVVAEASTRLMSASDLTDDVHIDLLLTLAKVARSVGSFDRAQALLDRADPLIARTCAPRDAPALQARILRASVLTGSARAHEMLALLEPVRADLVARNDGIGIEGLYFLSDALEGEGRSGDALSVIRQAEVIARDQHLQDLLLQATIQETRILGDVERFREALERSNDALALWRAQGEPPNPAIVELYGSIGLGEEAAGDMARAEFAYREAVALGKRIFDKPNRVMAWAELFLGSFLMVQGRFDEAVAHEQRAVDMRRIVLGEADPSTVDALGAMGKVYFWMRDYVRSEQWLTQGIDTCAAHAVDGDICARLLSLRARTRALLGRRADADQDISAALEDQRAFSGDADAGYAWILDNLIYVQLAEHDDAGALATADRVLALRHHGGSGMMQADLLTRFNRARALFELRRNDEALSELLAIEPVYSRLFPHGTQRLEILAFKARALARAGRVDEARAPAREAAGLAEHVPGVDAAVLDELRVLAAETRH